jgi:hypothetical protein
MGDDFVKKRLERDLGELKRMCDDHFQKRAADDENIQALEGRMNDRKAVRLFFYRTWNSSITISDSRRAETSSS